MNIYLDTSSLIKLYNKEQGTKDLLEFISKNVDKIFLSELAKIDFNSAILKKVRTKELSEEIAYKVISFFEKDYPKFNWIIISQSVLTSAKEFVKIYGKKGLRTLDAIQLACAVTCKNDIDIYKTADNVLQSIFILENLPI